MSNIGAIKCPTETIELPGFKMIMLLNDTPLGFRLAGAYLQDKITGLEAVLCQRALPTNLVVQAACVLSQKYRASIVWTPIAMPIDLVIFKAIHHHFYKLTKVINTLMERYQSEKQARGEDHAQYLSFFLKQIQAFQNRRYIEPPQFIEPFESEEIQYHHIFGLESDNPRDPAVQLIAQEFHSQLRAFAIVVSADQKTTIISRMGDPTSPEMEAVLRMAIERNTRIHWINDSDNLIAASLQLIKPIKFIGQMLYLLSSHMERVKKKSVSLDAVSWRLISQQIMLEVESCEQQNAIPLKIEVN